MCSIYMRTEVNVCLCVCVSISGCVMPVLMNRRYEYFIINMRRKRRCVSLHYAWFVVSFWQQHSCRRYFLRFVIRLLLSIFEFFSLHAEFFIDFSYYFLSVDHSRSFSSHELSLIDSLHQQLIQPVIQIKKNYNENLRLTLLCVKFHFTWM